MQRLRKYSTLLLSLTTSVAYASGGEGDGGGAGLFSGNFGEALWTIVAFVCLFLVLKKYAWGTLLEGLQAREQHIKGEIDSAETARRKAESLLSEYQVQGEAIVKSATEDAQKKSHQILEQTRAEAKATKDQAQGEIDFSRDAAVDRVREQAVDLVSRLAGEVMARRVTPEDNEQLIQEALGRLSDPSQGAIA
ncbi:F0F1 ATP synthase subunit B [Planctomycetota bacterium]